MESSWQLIGFLSKSVGANLFRTIIVLLLSDRRSNRQHGAFAALEIDQPTGKSQSRYQFNNIIYRQP